MITLYGLLGSVTCTKNLFLTILECQKFFEHRCICCFNCKENHARKLESMQQQYQNYPEACNLNRDLRNIRINSQSIDFFVWEALLIAVSRLQNLRQEMWSTNLKNGKMVQDSTVETQQPNFKICTAPDRTFTHPREFFKYYKVVQICPGLICV